MYIGELKNDTKMHTGERPNTKFKSEMFPKQRKRVSGIECSTKGELTNIYIHIYID